MVERRLLIVDIVVDDKKKMNAQLKHSFFYIMMMTVATGKERTQKEWTNLILDAGFKTCKITPILGLRSVIEVFL